MTNFVHFNIRRNLDKIRYMIFQCALEPVLSQRILIGFEAKLEKTLNFFNETHTGIHSLNGLG